MPRKSTSSPGQPISSSEEPISQLPDEEYADIRVEKDLSYGTHPDQKLDLCRPKEITGKVPGIILIHGGGGDKESFLWFCQQYAKRGFVATAVNYREEPPPVYPKALEDVKAALTWLKARKEVDGQRIGASGGSLGGYLSSMLGTQEFENKVKCVANNFGPTDYNDPAWEDVSPEALERFVAKFFGDVTPEENPELYRQASPITYVSANDAVGWFFTRSKNDRLVPESQMTRMIEALAAVGIETKYYEYSGTGGGHANNLSFQEAQKLNQKKFGFMEKCLEG